ncbi:hypothetical protein VTN96DRAFT_4933 [Rasamsonia emersonii]|uniref:Adaptin ear-binding coat-associated protein n=1 Tax=Rasamsonia emersonii (strain ATCC 16479 / CBS 393.64 / IMI 116815) TaxID=1408163 RepID=A0A0F4YSN0_RASE3|nr:Adaptin ear-binding coat-associated protein [Rasamsonia emersonii CBS 393.64]KKA20618.1 Adaptin ear-binding coat-associated protein [Rasamsonia emersonii CBS 393.64]
MSGPLDPATGQPLPADALQRVLFIARAVHVYALPPLTSMKGYTAADWTTPDPRTGKTRQIFTARLRILETAIPEDDDNQREKVKTDILLEDPDSGNLFAAAPYTDPGAVEHVLDSSRFFVLRVVGEGKKALLGIGFEDRSEAFDFGVALQEARKILGFSDKQQHTSSSSSINNSARGTSAASQSDTASSVKDYSLKPGQTISVNVGSRRRPPDPNDAVSPAPAAKEEEKALFSIPPPPPASGTSIMSGDQSDRRRRRSASIIAEGKE